MVSLKSVEQQLKKIRFNSKGWGRGEIAELPNILMDEEQIFECVNGTYEGGFALLCATNLRMLLIDKKPLKFLTVEDLRFDMINQIDYSHRLLGARINVSAGNKNLKFTSYNQQRLRKLIHHIQHRMAEVKQEQTSSAETQQQHLEKINQQLQTYLLAQHEQQLKLSQQLDEAQGRAQQSTADAGQSVRPAPELADFLYAQSLMQHHAVTGGVIGSSSAAPSIVAPPVAQPFYRSAPALPQAAPAQQPPNASLYNPENDSLIEAGRREIFGAKARQAVAKPIQASMTYLGTEINPMRVAYAKLPMALRNRKFSHYPTFSARKNEPTQTLPPNTTVAGA